jgi:hypothetical protein
MLRYVADKRGFELDRDTCTSTISIEVPIFSSNQTRRFIVDVIVDLAYVRHCGGVLGNNNGYRLITAKSFSGREIKIIQNSCSRKFIIEIKPHLLSISAATAQVKTYQNYLRYNRWYQNIRSDRLSNPDLVILTLDTNDSHDQMLADQSITIYHVSPKDIKR